MKHPPNPVMQSPQKEKRAGQRESAGRERLSNWNIRNATRGFDDSPTSKEKWIIRAKVGEKRKVELRLLFLPCSSESPVTSRNRGKLGTEPG